MTGRVGYTVLRDKALACLLNRGFGSGNPTRLGLDTVGGVKGMFGNFPDSNVSAGKKIYFP